MQKNKNKTNKKKTDVNNEYTCFLLKLNAHIYFLEFQISVRCVFIVIFLWILGCIFEMVCNDLIIQIAYMISQAYSELSQTSKMEHFAKTFNGWKPVTNFAKSSTLHVWQASECASVLSIFIME